MAEGLGDIAERLIIVNSMTVSMANTPKIEESFDTAIPELRKAFDVDDLEIVLIGDAALSGCDAGHRDPSESITRLVQREGRTLTIDRLEDERHSALAQATRERGFHSLLASPINVGGTVVGSVNLFHSKPNWFDHDDVVVAEQACALLGVGSQLATTIVATEGAARRADEASQVKSRWLANVSHELRTPMNGVIAMADLLRDTELSGYQAELVETIRTSGSALVEIINDVLDFSKIEARKLDLEAVPFSLRGCIEDSIAVVAPTARDKDLTIAFSMRNSIPDTFVGDVVRIRQILHNLLGNAIKFTAEGEVLVNVYGRKTEDAKSVELSVAVTDTGIGIDPDRLATLFGAYTQAERSTTRKFGGTGLGLNISRDLAELMGGSLTATSVPGRGSTFVLDVALPVAEQQDPPAWQLVQPALSNRSVMIIEHSATNRRLLGLQAKHWGVVATIEQDTRLAIGRIAGGERFDAVVVDAGMPFMTGMAFAKRVHEIDPSIPIVMTADRPAEADSAPGIVAVTIARPIRPGRLLDALIEVVENPLSIEPDGPTRCDVESESAANFADRHPMSILIAEDNRVNQKVLSGLLARLGYDAEIASNGVEAVEAVSAQQVDVVLMDVQMPELDGVAATARIRDELPAGTQPQIIAVTANAFDDDIAGFLDSGMDDHLTKPIRPDDLTALLERVASTIGSTA